MVILHEIYICVLKNDIFIYIYIIYIYMYNLSILPEMFNSNDFHFCAHDLVAAQRKKDSVLTISIMVLPLDM